MESKFQPLFFNSDLNVYIYTNSGPIHPNPGTCTGLTNTLRITSHWMQRYIINKIQPALMNNPFAECHYLNVKWDNLPILLSLSFDLGFTLQTIQTEFKLRLSKINSDEFLGSRYLWAHITISCLHILWTRSPDNQYQFNMECCRLHVWSVLQSGLLIYFPLVQITQQHKRGGDSRE